VTVWQIAVGISFLGAWADDHFHSHWWFLVTFSGLVVALWNRRTIDKELKRKRNLCPHYGRSETEVAPNDCGIGDGACQMEAVDGESPDWNACRYQNPKFIQPSMHLPAPVELEVFDAVPVEDELPQQITSKNDEYIQGFAAAIALLIRNHNQPLMAVDIALSSGYALSDFVDGQVDSFDLNPITKAFYEHA
jgi:hypothetical protein